VRSGQSTAENALARGCIVDQAVKGGFHRRGRRTAIRDTSRKRHKALPQNAGQTLLVPARRPWHLHLRGGAEPSVWPLPVVNPMRTGSSFTLLPRAGQYAGLPRRGLSCDWISAEIRVVGKYPAGSWMEHGLFEPAIGGRCAATALAFGNTGYKNCERKGHGFCRYGFKFPKVDHIRLVSHNCGK